MKCDRGLVDAVREAVEGKGYGRVSKADAAEVSQTERWTLRYCLTEFTWTDAARDWLAEEFVRYAEHAGAGSTDGQKRRRAESRSKASRRSGVSLLERRRLRRSDGLV